MDDRADRATDSAFYRMAGACAIAAAIAGLVYSVAFIGLVVLDNAPGLGIVISSLALLSGAVLTVIVFAGLYRLLLDRGGGLVLVALLLGVTGAVGAAIHGGYDLAVAIHPPDDDLGVVGELPNAIDPRGLLTFGVSGIAALVASSLIARHPGLPTRARVPRLRRRCAADPDLPRPADHPDAHRSAGRRTGSAGRLPREPCLVPVAGDQHASGLSSDAG